MRYVHFALVTLDFDDQAASSKQWQAQKNQDMKPDPDPSYFKLGTTRSERVPEQ